LDFVAPILISKLQEEVKEKFLGYCENWRKMTSLISETGGNVVDKRMIGIFSEKSARNLLEHIQRLAPKKVANHKALNSDIEMMLEIQKNRSRPRRLRTLRSLPDISELAQMKQNYDTHKPLGFLQLSAGDPRVTASSGQEFLNGSIE
jgi:hypothetical protein